MQSQVATLDPVEERLGSAAGRFFGSGYKRVKYKFDTIRLDSGPERPGRLGTHVAVVYPVDWSKKSGTDLRPHLSTVDALLLAASASEMCLMHAYRPTAPARRRMWLRRVRIKAGSAPDERLDGLPVRAQIVETRPDPDSRLGFVSVLDVTVGAMRVGCEIEIESAGGEPVAATSALSAPEDLLGPAAGRYYGDGFTHRSHVFRDLLVDRDARAASAGVHLVDEWDGGAEDVADDGMEGLYRPAPTMVDCFVANLQLAQILLYQLDSMKRGTSNTLWMRNTTLKVAEPGGASVGGTPLRTRLDEVDRLGIDDDVWRTATIVGEFGATALRCAVTHKLPSA